MTLNLIFHFSSAVLVYIIVAHYIDQRAETYSRLALLSSIVYIFNPSILWFQQNVYFADTVVQPLFLASVYLFLRYARLPSDSFRVLSLCILLFFMMFVEWLGVFFCAALILFCVVDYRRHKVLLFGVLTTVFVSLSFFFYQYSQLAGIQALVLSISEKLAMRSGYASQLVSGRGFTFLNWGTYARIGAFYAQSYGSLLVIFAVVCVTRWQSIQKTVTAFMSHNRLFVYISLFPVLLHHTFLLNFTSIHDFSVLKSSLVLIVVVVTLIYRLVVRRVYVVFSIVVTSIVVYLAINPYSQAIDRRYQYLGFEIGRRASPEDTVYLCLPHTDTQSFLNPAITYYARRNVIYCDYSFLRRPALKILVDTDLYIVSVERL